MNFFAMASHAAVWAEIGEIESRQNINIQLGLPIQAEADQVIVSRRQYALSWDVGERTPLWVGWVLNRSFLGTTARSKNFKMDQQLESYLTDWSQQSVRPDDFKGTCIDKGHQVASGDRTSSTPDNQSTFLMSNIAGQTAFLNRRSWVSFEKFLRVLVLEQGREVFAYSGGSSDQWGYIGPKKDIKVSKENFKVVVIKPAGSQGWDLSKFRLLVLNFPNSTSKGTDPLVDREQACYDSAHTIQLAEENRAPLWLPYVTSLNAVEVSSKSSFKFLDAITPITQRELNDLINQQIRNGHQYKNPVQMLMSTELW